MVDVMEEWEDFAPFADLRSALVLSGLATTRHTPATVRVRRARAAGGLWWQVPHAGAHQWKGMDFAAQAEGIRKLTGNTTLNTSALTQPASVSACSAGALILPGGTRHPLHT